MRTILSFKFEGFLNVRPSILIIDLSLVVEMLLFIFIFLFEKALKQCFLKNADFSVREDSLSCWS